MPNNLPYLDKGLFSDKFAKWLESRVVDRTTSRLKEAHNEVEMIVEDLAELTPAWTGAAAGEPDRAVVPLAEVPSHPANKMGLEIGNALNGGESGWQINETARTKGEKVRVYITNPMWDPYLKFLEAGVLPHQDPTHAHFLQKSWLRHLNRRRNG